MKGSNCMAVVEAIGKIFGMFDKVDDIILEPVKLICDACRQPLKQLDHRNAKDKSEHEQTLKIEYERFHADLEQMQKDRDMHRTIEQQQLEAEINEKLLNSDLERREKMIQLEAQYREQMAKVATDIERIVQSITTESRDKIFSLYEKHKMKYIEVQQAYTNAVYVNVERMQKLFPGATAEGRIIDYMIKYVEQVTEESINFSKTLTTDMQGVLGYIDDTAKITMGLAGRYLAPAAPNAPALTENIAGSIEVKEDE